MGRAMKDSGVEWIGEIPDTWNVLKLKNAVICNQDKGSFSGGAYIALENIESGSGRLISSEDEIQVDSTVTTFTNQSVLFGKLRPYLAKVARPSYAGQCSTEILVLTPLACCDKDYLFWCLINPMFIDNVNAATFGVKMPRANWNFIGGCFLPIPSTTEQRTISAFLDSKCANIDSIIDQTRTSIEEYKHLKQAVITQAVTKGVRGDRPMKESRYNWIGNYPAEWKEIKIKWLLSERKERSVEGLEEPLSMSQKFGLIPTKEMDMIPNMASSFIGAKLVYCGDLVFNKLKAHLGVFSVSCYEGLVSPDYAVYYTTGLADMKFLEYLFKTPQYIAEFRKKSSGVGAGLTRLYTADLYSIYCALPSLDEQREIVTYLQEKCAKIDALIAKKEQLLTELEAYKKSLIYEYVTGKKEVLLNVH